MLLRHGCLALLVSISIVSWGQAEEPFLFPNASVNDPEGEELLVPEKAPLFGLIRPTDTRFNNFITPVSNPVFFEDPRNTSEARGLFINHTIPGSLGGKQAQVYAMQLRASLTENLSFIATKDGYIVSQNPLLDDGFADVAAGLKYLFYKDAESQTLLSGGLTYALPIGSTQSLQGRCSGEFNIFANAGTEFLPNWHYVTATGFRLPSDSQLGNQIWYWSNHIDWQIGGGPLYLFTEDNWYHYMSGASGLPLPIGGMDLFNLGATGIGGQNCVTGAWGVKYKPASNMELGVAYELPYTSRHDLMQNRITVDFIIRY